MSDPNRQPPSAQMAELRKLFNTVDDETLNYLLGEYTKGRMAEHLISTMSETQQHAFFVEMKKSYPDIFRSLTMAVVK